MYTKYAFLLLMLASCQIAVAGPPQDDPFGADPPPPRTPRYPDEPTPVAQPTPVAPDPFADKDPFSDSARQPRRANTPYRTRAKARVVVEHVREPIPAREVKMGRAIRQLKEQIVKEESDPRRKELASKLQKMLEHVFDADVARRNADLQKLEERMKKLRQALDRRVEARDRLIKLRVEAALLESEGLQLPKLDEGNASDPFSDRAAGPLIQSVRSLPDGTKIAKIQVASYRYERRKRTALTEAEIPLKTSAAFEDEGLGIAPNEPKQELREVDYFVHVPYTQTREIRVPAGEDVEDYVRETLSKAVPAARK